VLEKGDFQQAQNDEIYRLGMVRQFQLTFELAWKALKFVLEQDGVGGAEIGSARDILKLSVATGFLKDENIWLLMLKKCSRSAYLYNEEDIDALMILIKDSFIPAFKKLEKFLLAKQLEIEEDSAS
jgi:nucleotidyltransferase substrate binding protein (TIGR01987 family)